MPTQPEHVIASSWRVGLAAVSVATPSEFDAGRDLRVRLAFASVKAGASDVAARAIGLRPSPSSLASVERRSEYAGAVRR